jgi:lysozyme
MRGAALLAFGAALAAFFVSRNAQAKMTDAAGAGYITGGDTVETSNEVTGMSYADNPTGLSDAGLAALKQRESFSPTSYPDFKGRSIGYGHLIKDGENIAEPISESDAASLLADDVGFAEQAVNDGVHVAINQNQFDALVSFVFNVGRSAFMHSTLLTRLNMGDAGAVDEFARWDMAGGKVNEALVARRASEAEQFQA